MGQSKVGQWRAWCLLIACCGLVVSLTRAAAAQNDATVARPVIVLAGDSTVTAKAGWGAGFEACLPCINLAQGGRSSRSYRSEGWWQKCLDAKPNWLLIQFGHNDQPGKGPERESTAEGDFPKHLAQYVTEARAAGAQPILITSLERRRWNERGEISATLSAYAEATRRVARELDVPLIDLQRLSLELYNRWGETQVRRLEPMSSQGADHTHLNADGSRLFGGLVARELVRLVPELATQVRSELVDESQPPQVPQTAAGGLSLRETVSTLTILQGAQPLLTYNKRSPPVPAGLAASYARSGCLHPVFTPAGKTVTAMFPSDHPHQHGIFSAWVKTTYAGRKIDFWNLAGETGRVQHQSVLEMFNRADATGFTVELIHQTAAAPIVDILRERWRVTAYPTDGSYYCFDIDSQQSALTDKPLVIEEYHYGGMAVRGRVEWVQGEELRDARGGRLVSEASDFLNDRGQTRQTGNHQPARWVALHGLIEGKPVCLTVMAKSTNFRAPAAARLHPTKPYFCFSPCLAGSFVIDQQHPLAASYRYLLTDAEPAAEWIEQQWRAWHAE